MRFTCWTLHSLGPIFPVSSQGTCRSRRLWRWKMRTRKQRQYLQLWRASSEKSGNWLQLMSSSRVRTCDEELRDGWGQRTFLTRPSLSPATKGPSRWSLDAVLVCNAADSGAFLWFPRACMLKFAVNVQLKRMWSDYDAFMLASLPRSIHLLRHWRQWGQQAWKWNIAPQTGRWRTRGPKRQRQIPMGASLVWGTWNDLCKHLRMACMCTQMIVCVPGCMFGKVSRTPLGFSLLEPSIWGL